MDKRSKEEISDLAKYIGDILNDKKAVDVEILDISEKTSLTDLFVICSGNSTTQVKALASEVELKVKERFDLVPRFSEGFQTRRWVLLDYIDVVVHIFLTEERSFYSLERLWRTNHSE
ncbi:MAG: ribosome silencing factor [Clostridia bacterium]|nr:ribosome silencing factor [Clostridia bacterium]